MNWYTVELCVCGICGCRWIEINKGQEILCPYCNNPATYLEESVE